MNFSAVILAGGKSSRMGRDKAFLKIGGQTLLARQIQLARELGAARNFYFRAYGDKLFRNQLSRAARQIPRRRAARGNRTRAN